MKQAKAHPKTEPMTEPLLHLQIRTGNVHSTMSDWPYDAPVRFGRLREYEVVLDVSDASSRHMGTLVPAAGMWWLVNPVHLPDETAKRPITVTSDTGRWDATVLQGGWLALPPGSEGVLRPYTTGGTELYWRIDDDIPGTVADTLRWELERRESGTGPEDEADRTGGLRVRKEPDAKTLAAVPALEDIEDWEREMQVLEEQLDQRGEGIRSAPPIRLPPRAMDFLITSAYLSWRDPNVRMLTAEEVSAIWKVKPDSVERAIRKGLRVLSEGLPDPIVWANDASRVREVLKLNNVLTQRDFDWQDLGIDYPWESPSTKPRVDGTVGPRRQSDCPSGWTKGS